MKKYLFIAWSFLCFSATAQNVVVPNNVYFADLHLKISAGGRQEIQKKVDALHKYPAYFKVKVDRADTYFPIIERVFQQEGLPDDFKYLALQESGLIGDAVSTSNAVGYWQFKKEAASDQGLRMNNLVDERKHIIESSRGAARYLIRNNAHYRNWVNTLLSYMEGFSGAKPYTKPSDAGARSMEITEKTHYYVLTFLAHKIAYENFVGKNASPLVSLQEVEAKPGQSLSEIALSTQIDPLELEKYNKWLVGSAVPGDKKYTVLIPIMNEEQEELFVSSQTDSPAKGPIAATRGRKVVSRSKIIRVNDLKAVIAGKGETKEKMARRGNMRVRKFLRLNEMRSDHPIQEGETYFLEAKRNRAKVEYHVAQPGETMASVSRKYGVREKALLTKNRMRAEEQLEPGRVVWLQDTRPRSVPVEYRGQKEAISGPGPIARSTPAPADTVQPQAPRAKTPARRSRIDWRGERDTKESPAATPASAPAPSRGGSGSDYVTADEENPEFFPQEWSVSATRGTSRARATSPRPATTRPAVRPGTKPAPSPTSPATPEPAVAPSQPAPVKAEPVVAPAEIKSASEPEEASEEDPILAAPVEEPVLLEKAEMPAKKEAPAAPAPKAREIARPEPTDPEPVRPEPTRREPVRVAQPKEKAEAPAPAPAKPAVTAAPAAKPSSSGTHTVAKGETLFGISRQYGVSVADLKEWNNLGEKPIAVGQELLVAAPARPASPAPAAKEAAAEKPAVAPGGKVIHTVATGETIYQISRKYGVTIKEVMEWNKKSDFNVKVGEELTIKPKN